MQMCAIILSDRYWDWFGEWLLKETVMLGTHLNVKTMLHSSLQSFSVHICITEVGEYCQLNYA